MRPLMRCWKYWVSASVSVGLLTCIYLIAGSASGREADGATAELAESMLKSLDHPAGLCVHLGVRDGDLVTALSKGGTYLVHGLGEDQEAIDKARRNIAQQKLSGVVSVEIAVGSDRKLPYVRLPYSDNLVNLLAVDDIAGALKRGLKIAEVLRVLRPGGAAWIGQREADDGLSAEQLRSLIADAGVKEANFSKTHGLWAIFHKPRPADMDQWTHQRHDASGNPVSADRQVGVPTGLRWVAGPNWPTGYRKSAVPAVVATDRRLIYIFEDEVDTPSGPKQRNSLIARDAYNGLLLWKRSAAKGRSPLISVGNRVYAVVQDGGPLVALDALTGKVVRTFTQTKAPSKVIYVAGKLIVTLADGFGCLDAKSGETLWKKSIRAGNLLSGDGRVFVQGGDPRRGGKSTFVCFDLETGKEVWSAPTSSWTKSTPQLVFYQAGVLVAATREGNHAVSAKNGKHLWSYSYPLIGHGGSNLKVLYMDGLVWVHAASFEGKKQYAWEGLDPQTGKVVKRVVQPADYRYKHRCSYDVATNRYFLCGSMDFADLKTGEYRHFTAARNSCAAAGVVPANGLVYTFPHACGCYAMLRGFIGLSTDKAPNTGTKDDAILERGPGFGKIAASPATVGEWPMYRHDAQRSAASDAAGPEVLKLIWTTQVADPVRPSLAAEWDLKDGGRLSSPVVAAKTAFVAASDHHRLQALDAQTGKPLWSFTAGGRIDCPPTIAGGLCLFGSRDGWVYCLRSSDGELVWRFRAAPQPRRIVAYGQLESPWPVTGGVLLYNDMAYFASGRHSGADGGVFVYGVDPKTGRQIWVRRAESLRGVADVLTGGEGVVQMAGSAFDANTGKPVEAKTNALHGGRLGLLADGWYKRPIAMRKNLQKWTAGKRPSGQMLAFNEAVTCGYRASTRVSGGDGKMYGSALLFAKPPEKSGKDWSITLPLGVRIRGMALTKKRLYVAGRLYDAKNSKPRNVVRIYDMATGKLAAEREVEGPLVHDGLVVSGRRVYVSTQTGKLICLGE